MARDDAPWRSSRTLTWLPNDRSAELARDHRHHSSRTYVPYRGSRGSSVRKISPVGSLTGCEVKAERVASPDFGSGSAWSCAEEVTPRGAGASLRASTWFRRPYSHSGLARAMFAGAGGLGQASWHEHRSALGIGPPAIRRPGTSLNASACASAVLREDAADCVAEAAGEVSDVQYSPLLVSWAPRRGSSAESGSTSVWSDCARGRRPGARLAGRPASRRTQTDGPRVCARRTASSATLLERASS